MKMQLNYAGVPVSIDVPEGHGVEVSILEGQLVVNLVPQEIPTEEQAVKAPKPVTKKKAKGQAPQQEKGKGGARLSDEKLTKYQEALRLVRDEKLPKSQAAKKVGVSPGAFYSWSRKNAN